ncbi:MAG: 3-keto-5-aminohexanoate cleavage protein [Alphaproteobacteria bacterium]|nr:3-keto-5-aminohexanoate cleavage protein [Alphaproteobacteria bacterium]
MRKVWIEVALNGAWSRKLQPGIPDTLDAIIEQGVACAQAGASIIHTHAYENGGRQTFDWQVYARIIEGIRAEVDVPVYPSYPAAPADSPAAARFAHVEALAERGLLEFAVVDPGSVNFTTAKTSAGAKPADTYLNPEAHVRHALDFAARKGLHPAFAIYEPGFTRAGAALAKAAAVKPPIYRLMFTEGFAFGFPPRSYALAAHIALLEEAAPGAPWMAAGLAVDVRPLIAETVAKGGHLRVGLEDAPLGSTMSNVQWVEDAVRLVQQAGGEPATGPEVRQALAALA